MVEGEVIKIVGGVVAKGAKHWLMRTLSVVCVLGLFWAVYVTIIKPHVNPTPTTSQTAKELTNYYITEQGNTFFFGVQWLGFEIGVSRPDKSHKQILKQANDSNN